VKCGKCKGWLFHGPIGKKGDIVSHGFICNNCGQKYPDEVIEEKQEKEEAK